jgi:hypothetical protein
MVVHPAARVVDKNATVAAIISKNGRVNNAARANNVNMKRPYS